MYYPLLRGKQFELAAIRDLAEEETLRSGKVCPIVEPVRKNLSALDRTLGVWEISGTPIGFIINPRVGDFVQDNNELLNFFKRDYLGSEIGSELVRPVLVVNETTTVQDLEDYSQIASPENTRSLYFLHDSAIKDQDVISRLNQLSNDNKEVFHLFEDERTSMIYREKFKIYDNQRAIIRDEFISEARNKDYKENDFFTDLNVIYKTPLGLQGFGDYQIVGAQYRESGGPAYAVALHITYIDPSQDKTIYVQHFISKSNDTFADPGNKFSEALDEMISFLDKNEGLIYEGRAIREFRNLHDRKHFPGLGFVKKLSIQHHIELMDDFLLTR